LSNAVIEAQDQIERYQTSLIRSYFDENNRPHRVELRVPSLRAAAAPGEEDVLSVPLLALVSSNRLAIKDVKISLNVTLGDLTSHVPPDSSPKPEPTSNDENDASAEWGSQRHANAMAVDPFIAGDVMEDGRLVAKKGTLFDLNEPYDLIAFHHSFEHMHPPRDILEKAHNLLKPGGSVLLRIPTVTSEAFETYGANWSDLDAPRHFYLHSHDSIQLLAEQAGFKVIDLWCDSNAFQFWASEQYAQDIPLNDPRSHTQPPIPPMFTSDQMAQFEAKAQTLNAQMRGDAICVWLKPAR